MGSSQGTGFRLFRRLLEAPHLSLAETLPEVERTVAASGAAHETVNVDPEVVDPSLTAPVTLSRR